MPDQSGWQSSAESAGEDPPRQRQPPRAKTGVKEVGRAGINKNGQTTRGCYKILSTEFIWGGGFQYWINAFIKDGAYPFMKPVLTTFVLPHSTAIAILATYGGLAIAVSLISGLLVRVASIFGAIFMLTLLFCANYPGPHVPLWRYFGYSLEHSVFFLCFVTFAVSNAAEALSIANTRWWQIVRVRLRGPRTQRDCRGSRIINSL